MTTVTFNDDIAEFDAIPGFWDACDAAEEWINARPTKLHNPSSVARGAKIDKNLVYIVLRYLDKHRFIVGEGNGCWRKYAAR